MRVWDRKRQVIWVLGGLIIGTYIAYSDSLLEDGAFIWRFFVFMEAMILLIMGGLFYLYSRR
ncbi:MAG TPA: hypothetical protein VGJ37_10030 [Pyrinomonadaceae bacterium]|jgi:hypothetical protein